MLLDWKFEANFMEVKPVLEEWGGFVCTEMKESAPARWSDVKKGMEVGEQGHVLQRAKCLFF